MNYYLILSEPNGLVPSEELLTQLRAEGTVTIIKTSENTKGFIDKIDTTTPCVLGIDPDVCDWNLDVEPLLKLDNIKAVCTQSNSFDWISPKRLKEKNIVICNLAGFSTDSVAEYAICMAMEGAKKLPIHLKNNFSVDWKAPVPMLLKGKTLGVVGLGRIGTRVAEIAKGIGMNVVYWSKNKRNDRFKYLELDELFSTVDILIPTFSENEETTKLVTTTRLDLMKKTSIVVGLNRIKNICNEDYIIEKVSNGEIGGYAFEGDNAKPYTEYKGNIWPLPSLAWYSDFSLEEMNRILVENMISVGKGDPQNVV